MRRLICLFAVLAILVLGRELVFAEGTKQLMPNSTDRLYLEFNTWQTGSNDFAGYDCSVVKRLNIRLNAGEKVFFGFKMNTVNYGGNVNTNPSRVRFRIKRPDGTIIYTETAMPTSGTGYIANYTQAITGPNGIKLNGTTISGGYSPRTFTADQSGDYYIEFKHLDNARWALEFFDITVTDANNNIITNPGEPNIPAGRIWSKSWQMSTTSFTEYPVNNFFYIITGDEFVNKINFRYYPFSFKFQSNAYGIIPVPNEPNYIKRAQSKENDQTANAMDYPVFLDDPDRTEWATTRLAPPKVQVWAEDTLFYDYDYVRTPMELPANDFDIYLEKNRPGCPYSSVAIFKIQTNIDAFVAILIDVNHDGAYSTDGSDRVIYLELDKGTNYILWDFKTDAGADVPVGNYSASATFMGRGPTNFPVYDVEQCDGVVTSSVRPFRKLNATIYWDDTYITRWGDETGQGLMDETQKKQLVHGANIPRIWSWNAALQNTNFNGNMNTMNTWFYAIDLGYSNITVHVSQSSTKCIDGLAPWVGDIYKETALNTTITFAQENFTDKFFDPTGVALSQIRILSLPGNGTLYNGSTPISSVPTTISAANTANLKFVPNSNWWGRTSFNYEAQNADGRWSNNQEKVYLTINTPPTITPPSDQNVCTNATPSQLPFTVSDGSQTSANDITITAYSHDPNFVLNGNIVVGGSGTNRWVEVTPVANKSGNAIIYLLADDGYSQTIEEFTVYVGPDLEFSGDTTVCEGQDLSLVAQEQGATYEWKYGSTTISTSQTLSKTWGSFNPGQWSLTVSKGGCTSTRNFTVEIAPNTSFSGDANVCVGEPIDLSANEYNASYVWRKGTTVISTSKQYYKASATLSDSGNDYTLEVTKAGCNGTSAPFTISVVNPPSPGIVVNGSTVDPGHDGTITVSSSETGITYNVYKNDVYVTSGVGTGGNITITVPSSYLEIGENTFVVKADNGNCEIALYYIAKITVRTPGFTISAISGNTTEGGGTATFTVVLKTQPTANVTLPISTSDATEGTVSPANLTFTSSNWDTHQTVTVTGTDDYLVDGNITYTINIGTSSSSDTYYNGIDPNDITLQNIDNDAAGVYINPTSLTTAESGTTAAFSVRLTAQPAANVTITLTSGDLTEGTINKSSLTFTTANWNTNQSVTVTGVDDEEDDGDITYLITTSNTSSTDPTFNNIAVTDVTVTNTDNDAAGILVSQTSGLTTTETGGQANFTIRLNSQPLNNVTIGLSSSNTSEGTVSPTSVVFTPANWNTPQTITITGVDDDIDDGNQPYTIITAAAVSTDSKYNGLNPSDVSVVNVNDDVAGITVTPTSGLQTTEAGGSATFTVRLNTRPTSNVTINLTTTNPAEGVASPTTITFTTSDWNTTKTVTVTGQDEYVDDGDQTYSINGSASSSDSRYDARSFSVTATNIDNDEKGIAINPTTGLVTSESGQQATFTIVLTSQPSANVTLGLSSSNTAEGTVSPSSVTFTTANWNIPQTVTVTGVDDAVADGSQSYTIITAAASSTDASYNGINPTDVSVTNNDNDVAGITVSPTSLTTNESGGNKTFTIALNTQPTSNVTINISSDDLTEGTVSPSSVQFTSSNWSTPQTVTVTPVDDNEDDGDITYHIATSNTSSSDPNYNNMAVSDVTVVNVNDDVAGIAVNPTSGLQTTEDGGQATFTIRLNSKPTASVSISLSSSDVTEGTVNPSSVTFTTVNWNAPQTVTVTGVDDNLDDDNITYTITTAAASSSDTKYNGINPADVSVTNIDNDEAGFTIIPTSGLQTTENGGTAQFTVKLNTQPTDNVTINLTSSNPGEGTVNAGSSSLTFNSINWNSPQTVTITGVDDDVDDDNVAYTIITYPATSSDSKYSGKNPADASVTNIDNDTFGFTVSPTSITTSENVTTAQFTIKLNSRPTANVTIPISSSNTAEGTVNVSSVTLTPATWNVEQTVIVTGVDDNVDDDNVSYTIVTGNAVSSDTKYSGQNPPNVSATNLDNDVAGITVNPTSGLETTEAGGQATYSIVLNTRPTANVTIGLSSSNIAEGTVSPTSITISPANWNNPVSITVTGVDDNVDDGDIAFNIITSNASSSDSKYNGLNAADVSVTNKDNDEAGVTINPFNGLTTTEDGGTATFTVKLNSQPTANVNISFNSDNTNEGTISPVTLTFTSSNWNVEQTITIIGIDDDVDDDNVAYTIITQPCVSSDTKYDNLDPIDVSVTNTDNDVAGYIVNPTSLSYSESDAPVTVTFKLATKPTADVSLSILSNNTSKGTISPASLTFTTVNWNVEQNLTITPVNNYIDDGDIDFTVETSGVTTFDSKYTALKPSDIFITCIDDDQVGIDVSSISGNTREDGTNATFTIKLNSEPTGDVTIGISSNNTAEGTVSPSSVTFNSSNWSTTQTVTITGVDDMAADGNQTYIIILAPATSSDANYNGIDPDDITLQNIDNDQAGVNIFPVSGLISTEAGGTATFEMSLNTSPAADVVATFVSSNTGEGTVSPNSHTFNSTNWNTPVTITLTGVDDNTNDGDQAYQVNITTSSTDGNYNNLSISPVTATNNDDVTPRPVDDNATTDEVTPINIDVISNDKGLDKGIQSVTITTQPDSDKGSVQVNANNTIRFTPVKTYNGPVTFSYRVTLTNDNWAEANVAVTVTAIDDTPIAVDDSRGTSINQPRVIDVLINDTGLEDGGITVSIEAQPQPTQGSAVANVDNTITFTPATDYSGSASFQYRVTDGDGDYDVATVYVNVRSNNHIPVANDDAAITAKNTPKAINVLANDSDLDDGFGSITIFTQPTHGSVVVNTNRTITYTPNADYIGNDSFVYMLQDVDGDYDLATVTLTVNDTQNSLPIANPDSRATSKNVAVRVDVLTNDTGLNDGVASLTVISDPSNGSWLVNSTNDSITYSPNTNYVGTDAFQYQVCDNNGDCSVSTVTITVKDGINITPLAINDTVSTNVNTPVMVNVLKNDRGLEDGFGSLTVYENPQFGSVQVNANRTITYTPTYMFMGTEEFYYMIADVDGDLSIAKVVVNITETPDYLPIANDDRRGCSYNQSVNVDVLFNDIGLDDAPVVVTIKDSPTSGNVNLETNNTITFTPANNFVGDMTFSYTVTDADGDSDDALVTITVKDQDHPNVVPIAVDDNATTKFNTPVYINVLANDHGLDDGFDSLYIYKQPDFGTLTVNANRTVTYTPSYMFVGQETFQYVIEDVDGDYALATVTVTVLDKQNAIPIANDDYRGYTFNGSVTVDVLFNDSGLADEPVTVTISQDPALGTAVVNPDNTVTYTAPSDFVGVATFSYTVTDANGEFDDALVTITVKPGINHVPVAQNDNANTVINTSIDINVLANDTGLEDGFGNLNISTQPIFGTVQINANRTVTYYPSYMFIGTDTFQYLIEDVDGDYSVATVTVEVTEKPDALPIANDDRVGCSFNQNRIIDVLFNDTGLDDAPLSVTISQAPAQGTATVNPDNTVTFSPASGFTGTMTFSYTVTDADGDSDNAQVTINVKSGTNYIPIANDDAASTFMNMPVSIPVLANDTDLDDGFERIYIFSLPLFGTATVNANRTVTYTPSYMFVGVETFEYVVEDTDGDWDVATVTVTVTEKPNAVPIANDDNRGCSFNQTRVVDVLFNDTGLDDAPISVTILENPAQGSITVNPDNTITFTPEIGYIGTMTFSYTVTDADNEADDALVTIRVKSGENYVPGANNDEVTTLINTAIDINVLANDTGLNDGYGDLRIYSQPQFGTVIINSNRTIRYIPSNLFLGTDTFMYLIEDVDGDYSVATVTVNVVGSINHTPIANDDYRGAAFETERVIDVLFNDEGIEDIPLTLTITVEPKNGTASVNSDSTVTYTPVQGFLGLDSLTYRVTDVDGEWDEAKVFINVKPFNMIPEAHDDYATTVVNTPTEINVLANDTLLYEGIKSVWIKVNPLFGSVTVNANFTVTYTPFYFFIGNDEFTYVVEDIDGDYAMAKVYVTVEDKVNHIPVANDDRRGTSKNTPVAVDVLINDDGLDDGWITVTLDEQPDPLIGTAVVNPDNTITFTPATDYLGQATFRYFVTDYDNDTSNVATVTVNVKEVNFIPIAVNDTAYTTMNAPILVDVIANDNDLNDGVDYINIMEKPHHGFAYAYDSRNIRYIPSSWFVGNDSLTYMVVDEDGDYGIAKVYITIGEREDHKPKANPDGRGTIINTPVNIDVLFNDTGLEDGGIKLLITQLPTYGNVQLGTNNIVTYTPNTNYLGEDVFSYQVCDFDNDCSSANVLVKVKNSNLTPTAINDTITTYKNRAIEFDPTFNDQLKGDGGIVAIIYSQPINGHAVSVNPTYLRYTPKTDFFGIDSLWYYIQDIDGDYSLAKIVVNVLNRENYTPDAQDDEAETYANTAILIDVLTNDLWLNDGIKTVEIEANPVNANSIITADYKIQYTPLMGYKGTETLTYRVCDIDDECDIATVNVRVITDPNRKVEIPEAFSPNGDNINDTFEVQNIEFFQKVSLLVYNRWGNLVYKNENYRNDWNGTSNVSMAIGSKLPDGTYYYLIEIKDTGKVYKGSVYIKRSY